MSTATAITRVTAALYDLLNDGLRSNNASGVPDQALIVSALPPDLVPTESGTQRPQVNIFMYRATPNTRLRNTALPSRDLVDTARGPKAPLVLDLYYMLTAYGAEHLQAELLLGQAMQLLHEHEVLATPDICFTLQIVSITEMTELWLALRTPYRSTAVYMATSVIIESRPTAGT